MNMVEKNSKNYTFISTSLFCGCPLVRRFLIPRSTYMYWALFLLFCGYQPHTLYRNEYRNSDSELLTAPFFLFLNGKNIYIYIYIYIYICLQQSSNIQPSFFVQNLRTCLVRIDHVTLHYMTTKLQSCIVFQ